MGTHTYYTHQRARRLLGIDGKTLNKWLEAAHIEPQPDPRDSRKKRISRTQLERLATLHRIELPEDDDDVLLQDLEQARDLGTLTLEMERLEQVLETMEAAQQKRFEQMQQVLLEVMEQRMTEVSQRMIGELDALLQRQLPQALSEYVSGVLTSAREEMQHFLQEEVATMRKELLPTRKKEVVQGSVAPAAAISTRETSTASDHKRTPPYVPVSRSRPHKVPDDLPEGTVSMRSFLEVHGSTRDIMTAAAKRGDFRTIPRIKERDGEPTTQYYLDPEMQDEAAAWLVKMGYGHTCEHCPHFEGIASSTQKAP